MKVAQILCDTEALCAGVGHTHRPCASGVVSLLDGSFIFYLFSGPIL